MNVKWTIEKVKPWVINGLKLLKMLIKEKWKFIELIISFVKNVGVLTSERAVDNETEFEIEVSPELR